MYVINFCATFLFFILYVCVNSVLINSNNFKVLDFI